MMGSSQLCLGVIAGAHGVRGEVRIRTFTQRPEDITSYGPLTDETGQQLFALSDPKSLKGGVAAQIEGILDRTDAEALKGTHLYVARNSLPDLKDEEFYHADLIGLTAVRKDGSSFGTVRALHNFGAGEMIEFDLAEGGNVLLPFTHDVVPDVDIAAGQIVVNPPNAVDAARENSFKGDGE